MQIMMMRHFPMSLKCLVGIQNKERVYSYRLALESLKNSGKKLLKMMGKLYQKLPVKLEQKKKTKMGRQKFEIDV
jgi:hypothetical protein